MTATKMQIIKILKIQSTFEFQQQSKLYEPIKCSNHDNTAHKLILKSRIKHRSPVHQVIQSSVAFQKQSTSDKATKRLNTDVFKHAARGTSYKLYYLPIVLSSEMPDLHPHDAAASQLMQYSSKDSHRLELRSSNLRP